MFKNSKKLAFVLSLVAFAGVTTQVAARPNVGTPQQRPSGGKGQLKTTAGCKPAEAAIDLDINNVRARLMTGGDMWWDNGTSTPRYEVPKGSGKSSLFAGSVWIGGIDAQGQLKVAAQTYRQSGNDYWPGPLDASAEISAAECSEWDRFWKVSKEDINRFKQLADKSDAKGNPMFEAIWQWPAKGNREAIGRNQNPLNIPEDKDYAPFIDVNGDGKYLAADGDYPGDPITGNLQGDQFIWWVFNDKGNTKGESQTEGIGIEVQASAFAYSTKDQLNDATFYNYRLINRGNLTLDSTYISTWTDADLGFYRDDYIGCDTSRGLGILYNGKSEDGQGEPAAYGTKIPMVGVDFFKGPKKYYDSNGVRVSKELKMEAFTYYNNDFGVIGNPRNGSHIYGYMSGTITNGERFTRDFAGPGVVSKGYGSGPVTKFVFTGDPGVTTEWSECACNNPVDDRRFVHSSGPFKLEPGVSNDITIGAIWVNDVGGCPNTSFRKIRAADDLAQALFNRNFQTIEGPEAPRVVVREMDRKLVLYLVNDPVSNNYNEQFGYNLTERKYRVNALSEKPGVVTADSLYKFEGYRVFQVKNSEVQPAQIFAANGEVNTALAVEVFQSDIKNGVTRIINYERNTDISDSTWVPLVKVNGKDSGIRHSFELTIDQFATGNDKRFVNYRNYYFVAVAYAHNNFTYDPAKKAGGFDPRRPDETQDKAYLESGHAGGGAPIPVVAAMPNPANGNAGTVLNANYGDGVIIKRLEGRGNGGIMLQLSQESEAEALVSPYQSVMPTYQPGSGPIAVKVIDPLKLKPHDWELSINGAIQPDTGKGLDSFSTWELKNTTTGEVIYSERDISVVNEQILEKFGLSVAITQVKRPGDDQVNGNGYLGSQIIFADPAKPWLSGVKDAEGRDAANWIRSGNNNDTSAQCNYDDLKYDTSGQFYEKMLSNNGLTEATWAPYNLGSQEDDKACPGFGTVRGGAYVGLSPLPSVDVVFTSDKSKWTRCVVLEMQDAQDLAERRVKKYDIRGHRSWNLEVDANGRPVYSSDPADTGMSWFPGYAINQETGERLNIIFGEDSWLKGDNGNDMIWNPSSEGVGYSEVGEVIRKFGGKHFIYILDSKYDEGAAFKKSVDPGASPLVKNRAYQRFIYTGMPVLNKSFRFTSFEEGFIPTETRLRFRVARPYAKYNTGFEQKGGMPLYGFSTKGLAPTELADNPNADKQALLDKIQAVPNPYYGYNGYEQSRLDTRVRIINLPRKATVSIYSLDGALIARLTKDNANASYIDWNIRNTKGLPIASGMYLMHIEAEGIGETVVRWFGAMRPLDISQF